MPKVDKSTAPRKQRQAYPGRLLHRTDGCWKTRLGDAVGLTQMGIGEVELKPGASTGLYHWHEEEDEFVYVLQGEVIMVEGDTEYVMGPGDCAGWRAGVNVGHTFENRTDEPVKLLEIGPRTGTTDTAHYPGLDMLYRRNGRNVHFETRDGRTLTREDEVARLDDPDNLKPQSSLDIE